MLNEAHASDAQRYMLLRDLLARARHEGCGGRAAKAELLIGVEGVSSRPVRWIVRQGLAQQGKVMVTVRLRDALLAILLLWAASASADTDWLIAYPWHVFADERDGTTRCYLELHQATAAGHAGVGFSQAAPGGTIFAVSYKEDGVTWDRGGILTIQIDSYAPLRLQATVKHDPEQLLMLPEPRVVGQEFWPEFFKGSRLRITTDIGTRIFSLSGSLRAQSAYGQCLEAAPHGNSRLPPATD
jgi:hypothetical protein